MPCLIIAAEFPIGVVESVGMMFMYVKIVGSPFNGDHEEEYVVFTMHSVVVFARFRF